MRLVVAGGIAAGLSAASRARRIDPSLEIVVVEKGARISYGACGLPYFLEGQVRSLDELQVYSAETFERERDIRIRTNTEVVAIQHPRREVVLKNGERLRYDRLIWAAGARPERVDGRNVFTLHTDTDAARLDAFLRTERPRTAAVIGGGYIGLEAATALRARGLAVTLYHDAAHFLGREDETLTAKVLAQLEKCRVDVRLGSRVSPGETGADMVVVATGLKPNVEIPVEAGIDVGRSGALRVSETQETSLNGIYAAGDCCEALHRVTGRPAWIPLGTTANKMGRVAGANAAGHRERFEGIVGTSIVRIGGLAVATTGLSPANARSEGFQAVSTWIEGRDKARYFFGLKVAVQLVADRNSRRLLGGAVVGEEGVIGRINVIAAALSARQKVDEFAQLDLAYAPPFAPVMDPLLIAAQQLLRLID